MEELSPLEVDTLEVELKKANGMVGAGLAIPWLFLWGLNPSQQSDGDPLLVAVALNEEQARGVVMNHPRYADWLRDEQVLQLVSSPPTQVIELSVGWAWGVRSSDEAAS